MRQYFTFPVLNASHQTKCVGFVEPGLLVCRPDLMNQPHKDAIWFFGRFLRMLGPIIFLALFVIRGSAMQKVRSMYSSKALAEISLESFFFYK